MGGKRRKLNAKPQRRQPQPPKASAIASKQQHPQQHKKKNPEHQQKQHEKPTIPFDPSERIVLIGEGDLSFAASLATHHGCRNLVATVLEASEQELLEKYPHAEANVTAVKSPPRRRRRQSPEDGEENVEDNEGEEHSEEEEDDGSDEEEPLRNKIIYNIDATKSFPASITRPPPNRILFNFPHVGGKSTDVNRQVRHNQSLLSSFLRSALACLAPGGSVVVTLFEGEPYTLWNPRDLARNAGLQVETSFRFRADAYPGYRHARTLGVVRGKDGEETGWRGEERAARSFIFVRKGETSHPGPGQGKKRRRGNESDDDD